MEKKIIHKYNKYNTDSTILYGMWIRENLGHILRIHSLINHKYVC